MAIINNPLISVIVPVYNSEKYLRRCIDSILSQTYKNLEVILIDDESPDHSDQIIDEYVAEDSRVIAIHQKNMGTGPTRQKGLELSHGEYVAFVDNDDYILPRMYETMMNAITKAEADVCACQWNYEKIVDGRLCHTCDTSGIETLLGVHDSVPFARNLYGKGGYISGVVCSIWNKLFRRDLLLGLNIANGRGEEETVNDWVFSKNIRVVVIPDEFYYWCNNASSVTHWKFGANQFNFLKILNKRHSWFQDPFILRETEIRYCNLYVEYYFKAKKAGISIPNECTRHFHQLFWQSLTSFYGNGKFYVRMILFLVSPSLYNKLLLK